VVPKCIKLYAIFLTLTLNQVLYYIALCIFNLLNILLLTFIIDLYYNLLFSDNTSVFLFILLTVVLICMKKMM